MSELCMGSYQRHYYRLGAPVREIVRRGQDTLYRLKLGRETQHIADMIDRYYGGGNYPQSLGELCIELAQTKVRNGSKHGIQFDVCREKRYIQELRGLMYSHHFQHTDWGDGIFTPHDPACCFERDCPIHGKWSFQTHKHETAGETKCQ